MFDNLLVNDSFTKKGAKVMLRRWFSWFDAFADADKTWHTRVLAYITFGMSSGIYKDLTEVPLWKPADDDGAGGFAGGLAGGFAGGFAWSVGFVGTVAFVAAEAVVVARAAASSSLLSGSLLLVAAAGNGGAASSALLSNFLISSLGALLGALPPPFENELAGCLSPELLRIWNAT